MLEHKNRFRHDSLEDRKSIQRYLKAITKGLASGELTFSDDGGEITLKPDGLINLKLVASEDDSRHRLEIRLSWDSQSEQTDHGPLKVQSSKS
jgi:amphi-Trp domain-containing protein